MAAWAGMPWKGCLSAIVCVIVFWDARPQGCLSAIASRDRLSRSPRSASRSLPVQVRSASSHGSSVARRASSPGRGVRILPLLAAGSLERDPIQS